jgi:hypothetical protein
MFRRSDKAKVNVGMDFKDPSKGLRINKFVFDLYAVDWVVSTPKTASRGIKLDQQAAFTVPPLKV